VILTKKKHVIVTLIDVGGSKWILKSINFFGINTKKRVQIGKITLGEGQSLDIWLQKTNDFWFPLTR
jgi:hypothetical protein